MRTALRAIPYAAACLYAILVAGHGVPVLRHDWMWPSDRSAVYDLITRSTSGWDPGGIGAPNLYINDYLIALPIAFLLGVLGSHAALFAFVLGIGAVCAFGAAALARGFGADQLGQGAAATIALFNPWMYAETVAGHTYMVLAFGASMALLAEYRRDRTRPLVAALLVVLALQQLQYFGVVLVFVLAMALFRRIYKPLITALIVALPVAIAVAFDFPAYRAVPYTLAWESSQSVAPAKAVLLSGYFAGYTQYVDSIAKWAMLGVLALALYGFFARRRDAAVLCIAAASALLVLLAAGLKGPLAGFERLAVTSFPPSAAFRELYDLLGFAAVGYVAGVGIATAGNRYVSLAAAICGFALVASWIAWSPWQWWVAQADVPTIQRDAPPNSRYALTPAFQPLQLVLSQRGSGLDPDSRVLPGGVDPINGANPSYPVDAALARFEKFGDAAPLAALSVSEIVARPWLASDAATLAKQRALPVAGTGERELARMERLSWLPEVTLAPVPRTCSVCTRLGAGAVFFGDVAGMRGPDLPASWASYSPIVGVRPPNVAVHAEEGWVDARLAFAVDPNLAQGAGGAMTVNDRAVLPVQGGLQTLVFVRGELRSSDGDIIAHGTGDYRWVTVPVQVHGLRCAGLCVVAAQAIVPNGIPLEQARAASIAASWTRWQPWLISTSVPSGPAQLLRFNAAFDPRWSAFLDRSELPHFRVDETVNGWMLPSRSAPVTVTVVETSAALEAIAEVIGAAWSIVMLAILAAPVFRRRATQKAYER